MDTKVLEFPNSRKGRAAQRQKTDADIAAEIKRTWRKLWRLIHSTRRSGLDVSMEQNESDEPHVTRTFK